jgi:hypothetical protein
MAWASIDHDFYPVVGNSERPTRVTIIIRRFHTGSIDKGARCAAGIGGGHVIPLGVGVLVKVAVGVSAKGAGVSVGGTDVAVG